uniref:Uncharacterized protein n=1 Tax=Panagrolaimus superbus TaxID=310955 RepID=A0A914YT47_9BILA
MKINSAILKKNSRSTTNLASDPSTSSLLSQRNSDDDTLNSPRKAKQRRSNSVVRMAFKSFKKSFTNLTSDAFMSTPDPPGLANKKIPKPIYHQQTPITQSVSMDPSTTTSSDDTLSDFARRKHPEYSGVNIQEIRKVMSPKDSKKRPPIPNFDNRSSSTDEKKENEQEDENAAKKSIILRKRSSSGSKKPMGVSNAANIHRAATQMMHRRDQPVKIDRSRRSTAPVKTSIKRMQPVSRTSGLTLSQKVRPFHRRRSSSRRSRSNTSTSSSNSQSPNSTQEHLEHKGTDARRRRRMKKRDNSESLTNVYSNSTVITPMSPLKVQNSISPTLTATPNSVKKEPTSDLPLTSDVSSPELQRAVPALISPCGTTPKASMVSLITKKKATPPLSVDVNVSPHLEPLPLITPSPDSGCSLASSSKQLQTDSDHMFVVPELPKRFIRPAQVDIKPSGTSIYFHTESSRAKQKSPVHKSPLPHTSARRSSSATSSRPSSKSPSRRLRPQIIPASPSDHKIFDFNVHDEVFDGKERHIILNSTSNDDCNFPEVGRPSIAQIQGTGVVSRRIQQYKKLSNNSSKFPTTRGISGNDPTFAKPMGKPASHSLLWKKTNVNDTIPEQPTKLSRFAATKTVEQKTPIKKTIVKKKEDLTRRKALMDAMSKLSLRSPMKNLKAKSQNFGSSRAKSVTSMYSAHRNVLDSVRPSVSATSQISSSRIKKIECGTTISRYPKNA